MSEVLYMWIGGEMNSSYNLGCWPANVFLGHEILTISNNLSLPLLELIGVLHKNMAYNSETEYWLIIKT
jgi:hypothetical protein